MIQEVRKSIAFKDYVPKRGRDKDEDPAPTVTIDRKRGRITFNTKVLNKLSMANKFIAFYFEPTRKIIGWKVVNQLPPGVKAGPYAKWRYCKPYGKGAANGKGFWITSIKGILEEFNGSLKSDTYKDLEVKKYIETASVLDRGQVTYFVEVKEKTDKLGQEVIVKED